MYSFIATMHFKSSRSFVSPCVCVLHALQNATESHSALLSLKRQVLMVQFVNKFFSWISSIFVGFFKSSRFLESPCTRFKEKSRKPVKFQLEINELRIYRSLHNSLGGNNAIVVSWAPVVVVAGWISRVVGRAGVAETYKLKSDKHKSAWLSRTAELICILFATFTNFLLIIDNYSYFIAKHF